MPRIRLYQPGDEQALADVCLRTGDAGADATGLLSDDALWAEIFVLPYVARHPEFAFVVESDEGAVAGYCVAAPDTEVFDAWFRDQWWPQRTVLPEPASASARERRLREYADSIGRTPGHGDGMLPAHLHIDLLPQVQGQGWGRRLIEALLDALRDAGVRGIQLGADTANTGAIAFYDRMGFTRLDSQPGVQQFGMRLD